MADEVDTTFVDRVFNATDISGGAVDSGFFSVKGKHSACLDVELDNSGGMTAVAITVKHRRAQSLGGQTSAKEYFVPEIASGGVLTKLTISATIADTGLVFSVPINVADFEEIEWTVTPTGAGAGDLVTAYMHATTD